MTDHHQPANTQEHPEYAEDKCGAEQPLETAGVKSNADNDTEQGGEAKSERIDV